MTQLPKLDQPALDALEALIDKFSLASVLHSLAHIAQEKANHVAETWQDKRLSADWHKAAGYTGAAATRVQTNTRR